jgi:hypothetical protein
MEGGGEGVTKRGDSLLQSFLLKNFFTFKEENEI